jgi:hypothetical protein
VGPDEIDRYLRRRLRRRGKRLEARGHRERIMNDKVEIKTFRDLIVWQKAHEMDLRVIELVSSFPRAQPF